MQTKQELRELYNNKRNQLSQDEILVKSASIHEKLFCMDCFKKAETVFTYVSMSTEVQTKQIIEECFARRKAVAVPIVNHKKREMVFIRIKQYSDLRMSKFGILEPLFDEGKIVTADISAINIVPALLFSLQKYRIGYGGGYYDKYLSGQSFLALVGLCFSMQIVDFFEKDDFDIPVDFIVTENMIL